MRILFLVTALMLSMDGTIVAQQVQGRLTASGSNRTNDWMSHIEIDLGQRNTLLVGFTRYAEIQARRNVDSVLRLFVADYRVVRDSAQPPTVATHAFFRLSPTDRALDLRTTPQRTLSFRFRDDEEPVQVKTAQDTLLIVWGQTGNQRPYYDVSIQLFVNNLDGIEQLLKNGGLNARLNQAFESVEQYKGHDLTSSKMSFDLIEEAGKAPRFVNPGLARSPFIRFSPGISVGLIRSQWVPSFNLDAQFVPGRHYNVGYTIGYTSSFFFREAGDGRFRTFRNDFLNVGFTFYRFNKNGLTSASSRTLLGLYVGVPVHRRGNYFDPNTFRVSSTVYHYGLFKVQPEFYFTGLFKNVYPGLRLTVGL
ncbi:hypothetical protein BN8_04624 [Fibrisoma limi BUZ 3]|uniref:Uncharacterized protein n=1 Tax=Fibrisoma limi BUZ 3 TaxID=1185876 RepID=I2GN92_9BACT|nr:hypothetical protein [Fibrisoma limi]CCH55370.1 hypothetical protein BN8_04624 [Fibrisoma limi BUZ 3]